MTRISAITIAMLALAVAQPLASAEDKPKLPRIGFLNPLDRAAPHFEAFKQGLADLGYVDGRNVVIESRFAEGQYNRFPTLIAELVAAKVDILGVTGAVTARAVGSGNTPRRCWYLRSRLWAFTQRRSPNWPPESGCPLSLPRRA